MENPIYILAKSCVNRGNPIFQSLKKIFVCFLCLSGMISLIGCSIYGSASSFLPGGGSSSLTFTPASGPIGTLVTLSGADFTNVSALNISGISLILMSASTTNLTALIMPGTTSGAIRVTTSSGTLTTTNPFSVTASSAPANQQGSKQVATGATGAATQGWSVALSADGNTALVGGPSDNSSAGAAWVYTRSGTTWTQQGSKLVGTGAVGASVQGYALALNADGNTAIVGGYGDNSSTGAVWIYTRSGTTWTQQGSKLVGTGAVGIAGQGYSVALSADGNTAISSGLADNSNVGAVWFFAQ